MIPDDSGLAHGVRLPFPLLSPLASSHIARLVHVFSKPALDSSASRAMPVKWRPTLGQIFAVAAIAIFGVVLAAFSSFRSQSRVSIARASESLRGRAATQ